MNNNEINKLINKLTKADVKTASKIIKILHDLSINNKIKIKTQDFIIEDKKSFLFYVFDVFLIKGKGTLVTGIVASGSINKNRKIYIKKASGVKIKTYVKDIEMFNNKKVIPGIELGIFLDNISSSSIEIGDIIVDRSFWSF